MIRQSIKLIWNQRRKHMGLSFEIFFSFLVLFAVFTFGLNNLAKYLNPLGFSYERVWNIEYLDRGTENDSLALQVDKLINQSLRSFAEIDQVSYCRYNVPFSGSSIKEQVGRDNIMVDAQIHTVDDNYFNTMGIELIDGRFFSQQDQAFSQSAILVTEDLAAALFPDQSAVGKTLGILEKENRIVGVTKNFHYKGGVMEAPHAIFVQNEAGNLLPSLLLKVNQKADAPFEARLMKTLQQIVPGATIEFRYLEQMREDYLLLSIIPSLLLSIIGVFLIFNVALGLFGVLWQNISQRKQEIGVRRAMGSTKSQISRQFVSEILVLATMSIILGLFFAVQFPLLNVFELSSGIYIGAITLSIISIYFLVFVCSLIPSVQAAELHPALALRED